MSKRQKTSNTNGQHENDENILSGKRKPAEPPEPEQPTKINDLNDDCLEKIFNRLSIKGLFNVALSSKWLQPAADAAYKRRFGAKEVHLNYVHDIANPDAIIIHEDVINIYNFKTCIQFLRCFGSSIAHLDIYYGQSNSKRYNYVHQYIGEYCSESLVTVRLYGKPPFPIKQFDKPFVNVQNVRISGRRFNAKLHSFAKWFPNVRNLEINNIRLHHRFINTSLSRLEHLTISFINIGRNDISEPYECIGDLLQSSRQLKSLTISACKSKPLTMNSLLDMIENNRSITKLVMNRVDSYTLDPIGPLVNALETARLVRTLPLLVKLDLSYYRLRLLKVVVIIRHITSLEQIHWNWFNYRGILSKLDDKLITRIELYR